MASQRFKAYFSDGVGQTSVTEGMYKVRVGGIKDVYKVPDNWMDGANH